MYVCMYVCSDDEWRCDGDGRSILGLYRRCYVFTAWLVKGREDGASRMIHSAGVEDQYSIFIISNTTC